MIVLYGKATCPPCSQIKKYFQLKSVAYEYKDVEEPENAAEAMKLSGLTMVPIVNINGRIVSGYNLQLLSELL